VQSGQTAVDRVDVGAHGGKIGRKAPPPNRCWADSKSVSSNAAESDAALVLRFGEPSSRAEVEVL